MKRKILVALSGFIFLSQILIIPAAHAGIVSTKIAVQESVDQRRVVNELFERQEARALLKTYGVDERQLTERINKLTTEELALINDKASELPVGSGVLSTIVLILLLLIILDLIGVAEIFSGI